MERDFHSLNSKRAGVVDEAALSLKEAGLAAGWGKVLSNPGRVRMLSLITKAGAGGICPSDLSTLTGIEVSVVSHHLKQLKAQGLVRDHRRDKIASYMPTPNGKTLTRVAEMFAGKAK